MALGGGLELALLCDIRIAARNATFALPEAKIGSMPGSGGTQRLSRIIGMGRAMHLALSGDRINADEALQMGLISQVVEPTELTATALRLAERIADNAPLSVQMTRKAIRDGLDMPMTQGLALERTLFTIIRDTQDRAEGRLAFSEKRKPDFTGR
jgi:E-phenylitaconyl-CoA hydratase